MLLVCLAALLLAPFPFRIEAPCLLAARETRRVFVTIPGYPAHDPTAPSVQYGDPVSAGDPILQLVNHELEQDVVRLQSERDHQARVVENLRRLQFNSPAAATELPSAESALEDYERRWRQRSLDRDSLILRAPSTGMLLPPPDTNQPSSSGLERTGLPLDERNRDAFFETGTVVGLIGDPERFDAVLVVDQADMAYIREGQAVRVRLSQSSRIATGTVTEIAARPLATSPRPLVLTDQLPSRIDGDGNARPVRTVYEVRVALDEGSAHLVSGACGEARIRAGEMTILRRLRRAIQTTFVTER